MKPDAVANTMLHEPLHPAAACPDDLNASVAGEEDPGAALDSMDPSTNAPAAPHAGNLASSHEPLHLRSACHQSMTHSIKELPHDQDPYRASPRASDP